MSLDLVLAAIVPLGLALWLTAGQSRRELEKSARNNLRLLAQVTAARLDQLFQDTARTVKRLSRDEGAAALCAGDRKKLPAVQQQLQAVVETNPDFALVFVTDADGVGLAGSNDKVVGINYNFREYFRAARAGKEHVSEVIVPRSGRDAGVYFSAPVRAPAKNGSDHPIVGAVVLVLRAESFWEMVDEVHIGLKGYALLADENGVVLAHPRRDRLYQSFAPLSEETLARINPQATYGINTIGSLDLPDLVPLLDTPVPAGSVVFTSPGSDYKEGRQNWVAGFARLQNTLQAKPWLVLVVEPEAQFAEAAGDLILTQGLIGLAVAACAAGLALWRAGGLVRPVLAINKAARRLAQGDFHARAEKFADDEIGKLADTFNAMVPALQESVALQQSLSIAMEVQQSLLPSEDPKLPALEVAGRSQYCDSTGGDYFDYIEVSPGSGHILIAVGDVMGHGIASALVMAAARAALRIQALEGCPLSHLAGKVNRFLASDAHNRFMTLALMLIEPENRTVRWTSAGHDPILLYQPDNDRFLELAEGEVPLGLDVETIYHEHRYADLHPGDLLLVGTDGLWETPNHQGEQFGKERLRDFLRISNREPAAQIAERLEKRLTEFRGPGKLLDDVTFVVVKVK